MERIGQTLEKTLLPFPTSRRNSLRESGKQVSERDVGNHVSAESRRRAGTDGAGPAGCDLDGRPNHPTPVRAGRTALFTKAPRLLREVKETFHRNAEITQSEIIRRLGGLDLLVIDEVGVQFGTDTERMILYEILDLRYEAMRPVILTTNITDLKTLESLLGERIIDRLFEGESKVVFFDWESHRRFERTATDPGRLPTSSAATIPAGGKNP